MRKLGIYTALVIIALGAVVYLMVESRPTEQQQTTEPTTSAGIEGAGDVQAPDFAEGGAEASDASSTQFLEEQNRDLGDGQFRVFEIEQVSLPDSPLVDSYEQLSTAARNGDSVAAYTLSSALRICDRVVSSETELKQQIEELQQTHIVKDTKTGFAVYVDNVDERVKRMNEEFEYCNGISSEQKDEFGPLLLQAADEGLISAQLDVVRLEPPISIDPADDQAFEEFRLTALEYLEAARDAGSVEALYQLGVQYLDGTLVDNDPVEAYAYLYAATQAYESDTSRDLSSLGRLVAMVGDGLSVHQLEIAKIEASKLLENPNCCVLQKSIQ